MSLYRRKSIRQITSPQNATKTQLHLVDPFESLFALPKRKVAGVRNVKISSAASDSSLTQYNSFKKRRSGVDVEKDQLSETDGSTSLDTTLTSQSLISIWSQEEIPNFGPPSHLSPRQRLQWLQDHRNDGVYAMCDRCDKSRYLEDVKDPLELPDLWYCYMNPDKNFNACSIPEIKLTAYELEDLIYNTYTAGSIVWALAPGRPWWPAMVTDCPYAEAFYELQGYSDVPVRYNVIFFKPKMYMNWLKPSRICKFKGNEDNPKFQGKPRHAKKYGRALNDAVMQAQSALMYNIQERLKRFSYLARTTFQSPKCQSEEIHHTKSGAAANAMKSATNKGKEIRRRKSANAMESVTNKKTRLVRHIEKVNSYESKRKIIEIYQQYEDKERERINRFSQ